MNWDQIAKAWMQFVVKAVHSRSSAPGTKIAGEGSSAAAPFAGDAYEEARTAYTPDNHNGRDESSLHLTG